jgi:F-type H+-transporting ATPase subunit b
MPQLNPLDWGPQLIWLVITFGILYVLMKRIALPRIGGVIAARQARISGDLEQAERLHRETQEAIAAYEQALAEAKQKAHAIADQGRAKLKAEMAEEQAKLERELAVKAAEAEKRIETARVSALKDVNVVAADVATDLVKQLIGLTPSSAETEKAVVAARKE